MSQAGRQTQLYLATEADAAAAERLGVVLAQQPVAALLIRVPDDGAAKAQHIVKAAQAGGVAALIDGNAEMARHLGADGVHLAWSSDLAKRYEAARHLLGADAIIGASAGKSRHDAMTLGEAGADYIGFGLPQSVKDREGGRAKRLGLVAWWAEIFETPCVAFDAETAADASELADAGADFVCIDLPPGRTLDEIQAFARTIAGAMSTAAAAGRSA